MLSTSSLISYPVGVQILVEILKKYLFRSLLPEKSTSAKQMCFFSYIRLWRVLCTSCVMCASQVMCASRVRMRNTSHHFATKGSNTSLWRSHNITSAKPIHHSLCNLQLPPQFTATPCNLPDFMIY